jgi:hypothetical protein
MHTTKCQPVYVEVSALIAAAKRKKALGQTKGVTITAFAHEISISKHITATIRKQQ